MLVAGRSMEKAVAFCSDLAGSEPVVADRDGDLAPLLSRLRPDLLIDAAGPFQASGYRVPLACTRAGVPYLDLADARGFVCGIAALDEAALAAGIPVVSGASSVPALSGAVARHLLPGLDSVSTVEVALSASSRATAGASVAAAVLSYAGRAIPLWRGKRWAWAWGWQELRRETFRVEGLPPLSHRWVALADVPDHDLLPQRLPGRPAVSFRAGTEWAAQTLGLWLLSWPARWLRLGSLARMQSVLLRAQRLFLPFGMSDRSAMRVTLKGFRAGQPVRRDWTLIAADGDGPEIPTLAAQLLAGRILAGTLAAGARDAGGLLDLRDFEPLFAALSVGHETSEVVLPPPLFQRIMKERFAALPPAVQAMHRVCGDAGAAGEAEVRRGTNAPARLIGWIMRFPPAGRHPLHVGFREAGGVETWTRRFGSHRLASTLHEQGGQLVERFGPLRFRFDLPSDEAGLEMHMRGWSFLGVPLPLALAPRSRAREWQEGEHFRFDVPITLPLVGLLVHYSGWLEPVE